MKRILKWIGIGLVGLLGISAVAAAGAWYAAERMLDRSYGKPPSNFTADPAAADIEAGKRAALLRGCYRGCHGDEVGGGVFFDDPMFGYFVAPDLSRAFAEMTDADIDRAVRQGIRRDGRSMTLMPSASFHHLSDEDLNNITAFIRSFGPGDGPSIERRPGPALRFLMLRDLFLLQAERVERHAPWIDGSIPAEHALGRYLAVTICGECHGENLGGFMDFTPNLALTVAYSREDFGRLLREGVPIGDRELGLMAEVAQARFSHFTEAEVDALYNYLVTLAGS